MRKPYNPIVRNIRKDGTIEGNQGSRKGVVIPPDEFDSLYRMKVNSELRELEGENNVKNT